MAAPAAEVDEVPDEGVSDVGELGDGGRRGGQQVEDLRAGASRWTVPTSSWRVGAGVMRQL